MVRNFKTHFASSSNFIEEAGCLMAVLLAVTLAHRLHLNNVAWAAFSAFMVMRATIQESVRRGLMRVLGTACGVSLAWLLVPQFAHSVLLLSLSLGAVGAATLYLALLERSGYGWMFTGLSFSMVLVDSMQYGTEHLGGFIQARLLEVCVGTLSALLASALVELFARLGRLTTLHTSPVSYVPALPFCHQVALRHALKGALALAMIPWLWRIFRFEALSQSAITIITVMMVPMADLLMVRNKASLRSLHRFLGATVGALLATGASMMSHGSPTFMTLAAGIGVVIGRHIENARRDIAYAGTQFALAFLVVLVPDRYQGGNLEPGMERILGIVLGLALLVPLQWLPRLLLESVHRSRWSRWFRASQVNADV